MLGTAGVASAQAPSPAPATGAASQSDTAARPSSADASTKTTVADDPTLSEVVVTARARSETLIQAPVSVQAFSASQLAANNITNLATLQAEAGFTFNSQGQSYLGGGRQFPTLVFRGMTSNYGGGFADSGALFVDGIFVSGGLASVTFADVSQVEVLKGPQNVYFGKNTFGGAVNLITSHPSDAFHASASAGYSDKGSYDDYASVEGPIVPGLLTGRITGELFHQGAQYRAADGGPLGEQDTKGITAVLYATPTPDIWLQARFHYSHDHDSEADDGFISGATYGTTCPGLTSPYFCGNVPTSISPQKILSGTVIPQALLTAVSSNNFYGAPGALLGKVPSESSAGLIRDNFQGSVQGGVNLPHDAAFRFSLGYNQADSLDITSGSHTPDNVFTTAVPVIARDFEADARVLTSSSQPVRFVLGFNYFRSVYQVIYDGYYFALFGNSQAVNEKDEAYAGYGSAEWDILPYLTLTGEVRYQYDTVTDGDLEGTYPLLKTPVSKSYYHTLPRIILSYHPDKSTNLYLSYSEGVQQPQLQAAIITANGFEKTALAAQGVSTSPYTQDPRLRVWEIGFKKALFQDRLSFSADYYNQFWDHALVQNYYFNNPANHCSTVPTVGVSAACPYPGAGASAFSVSNNHIQGVELEATARITPQWTAHTTFAYTDALRKNYYDNNWGATFASGQVPSQNGKRIDLVPEFQWSLDSTYKNHLAGPYDWYVHGLVNYTSSQYVDSIDLAEIKDFFRVNLSAGIVRGNLAFEGYVTNLFDDRNYDYAVRFPDPTFFFSEAHQGVIAGLPNPRDFGFRITAKY